MPIKIQKQATLLFLILGHAKQQLTTSFVIPVIRSPKRRFQNHHHFQILKHMNQHYHLGNNNNGLVHQSSSTTTLLTTRDDCDYRIGTLALSERWRETVANGGVQATVGDIGITYGVRLSSPTLGGGMEESSYEEFVEVASSSGATTINEEGQKIAMAMNKTLSDLQSNNNNKDKNSSSPSYAIKSLRRGPFIAQLQLVRTLRPPPSLGFSGASTSSTPPPYDPTKDSFLVGSLRLELRPLMGRINLPLSHRQWDWYHNVSPADVRGHFLTLPSLSDETNNWRGQALCESDCVDMCDTATLISPPGALLLGYNSVGGGASQNHIHVHAWPSPPLPFVMTRTMTTPAAEGDNDVDNSGVVKGWNCYAASQAKSVKMMELEKGLILELLDYPVCALKISAMENHAAAVGKYLHRIIEIIGDLPHNVVFYNKPCDSSKEATAAMGDDKSSRDIVTIIFVRQCERSHRYFSGLKLGVSEMMGLFHCQSEKELEMAVSTTTPIMGTDDDDDDELAESSKSLMELALEDVSADKDVIWGAIYNEFVMASKQIPS